MFLGVQGVHISRCVLCIWSRRIGARRQNSYKEVAPREQL